jgi:alkylhydroperoxidase family enzyme
MPRIAYLQADIQAPADIVDAIRTRRGGRLLHLDRVLLHSPTLARGWNAFLGEVRTGLELPPKLRELAMCVVAVLNGAEYEFHHHAPEFLQAGGTRQQLEAIRSPETAGNDTVLFSPAECACIRLTLEMTRNVEVSDKTFSEARARLGGDRLVVELVGVIAAYNMVSRFLVALQIEPE